MNKLTESFLEQGKTGLEGINALPRTVEQAKQQIESRRKIVQALLKKSGGSQQ